ncbi:unnamed protein product [Sympodiomycopsis kandeliae]
MTTSCSSCHSHLIISKPCQSRLKMSVASPFETARSTHEESERYISALASILNTLPSGSSSSSSSTRSSLKNAHLASLVTDRIVSRNRNLLDFYTDSTGIKKEEETLLSSTTDDQDSLSLFYSRLQHIQSHHEKYPSPPPETFSLDLPMLENLIGNEDGIGGSSAADPMDRLFSGEEGVGRYLDLYEYHSQYINLKGVKRLSYLAYLDRFHQFDTTELNSQVKKSEAYKKYLGTLSSYLVTYLRKIRPLEDIDTIVRDAETEFESKWEKGQVDGWQDGGKAFATRNGTQSQKPAATNGADTAASSSAEGIWCEACQKSFAKQSVFDGHLQGNKHKKAVERASGSSAATNGQNDKQTSEAETLLIARGKSLAKQEYLIHLIAMGPLSSHRSDTRSNVERRAALTERERAAEAEEIARQAEAQDEQQVSKNGDSDDEEDEASLYKNPKKLPLGWDGRPIPVWLWKLHGLGVEYNCEICSDHIYHGRKNFDRHFSESRHAFGMRALGLPNTKHFHGITSIQDVLGLAEKLKKEASSKGATAVVGNNKEVEEVEDENGNTYSRKDYELLKRQGLI